MSEKRKILLNSLVDSKNSRTFAAIYRELIPIRVPLLTDLRNVKLANALAVM